MMDNNVIVVTDSNCDEVVADRSAPLLLAIGAPWCPDCKRIQPLFAAFSGQYAGKVRFAFCDYDNNLQTREKFQVQHIPAIFIIRDGKVADTLIEPKTIAAFREFVERNLPRE